jgi:hypothetical protein
MPIFGELFGRRLHEIAAGAGQGTGDAAIERQLGATHGVDHHPGGIGRIPDLQLELGVERDATEGGALHPDVGPFPVGEPRHMIARSDMDIRGFERNIELAGNRLRLGDLLGFQPLTFQHVEKVGVAAEIQLVGAVDAHAALPEEIGEQPVNDGRADLALDVVADQRQPALFEALPPLRARSDEHRDAVDESAACFEGAFGIKAGRLFRTHRQVGHQHFGRSKPRARVRRPRCEYPTQPWRNRAAHLHRGK